MPPGLQKKQLPNLNLLPFYSMGYTQDWTLLHKNNWLIHNLKKISTLSEEKLTTYVRNIFRRKIWHLSRKVAMQCQ